MPAKGQIFDTVLPKLFDDLRQGSSLREVHSPARGVANDLCLFALAIAAVFFASSLILLNFGRHLGLRYLQQQKDAANMAGLATVEGAVFALIGLLLAFTISGALQRFDERRQLVVQEANAASTAHDRLGLFEGDVGRNLQTKLKDYVEARIDLYRMPHDFSLWRRSELFSSEQQDKIVDFKNKVWNATAAACPQVSFRPACSQAMPGLTGLFEVARLRLGASEKHPPQIVYVMLFGLGLGGSLLAGFGMAAATARSWIHMLIFAATLTVTLYTVTDMEYPRLGLIRIEHFDHFLVDAHQQMQPQDGMGTIGSAR
jgi:preprotein translocase subunit SecG